MKQLLIITSVYIFSVFRLVRKALWKILFQRRSHNTIKISKRRKFKFDGYGEITSKLFASNFLWKFDKGFEHKTVAKFEQLVKPGDVVFDIGANIGMYSLLASELVGDQGLVYSFEPVKETYNALCKNVDLNQKNNIKYFQLAISDQDGIATIGVPKGINLSKKSDAFNSLIQNEEIDDGETISTQTLDSFVSDHHIDQIDFIKVDIEGAELLFLKGSTETFKTLKPKYLVIEAYEPFCKRFNYSVSDIIVLLTNANYSLEQYDDFQWLATSNNNK